MLHEAPPVELQLHPSPLPVQLVPNPWQLMLAPCAQITLHVARLVQWISHVFGNTSEQSNSQV